MISLDFLKQLNQFNLVVKKKVLTKYAGTKESPNIGEGLVFQDYKEYVPGDDYRAIDWKVYARTEELFVRRYEEERNLTVHIIVDSSGSMDFGSKIKKFEYASMIGLGFAYMAIRNNERFEFSTFSDKLRTIKPKKGLNQLLNIVGILNQVKPQGLSNFRESLESYRKTITSKSLVIVISDFLYDPDELKNTLDLFKKSELFCIQVLDPEEVNIPVEGDLILEDSETNQLLKTFFSTRQVISYKKRLEEHIFKLKDMCDKINAKFISVTTDTPIFDVFLKVLR